MDDSDSIITQSAAETEAVGKEFGYYVIRPENINPIRIFLLYGNLGSGKTTFVRGFAGGLGISERILSPTYIFIRQYPVPGTGRILYHIDLYRAKSVQEQEGLGLDDVIAGSGAIILIEWAEYLRIKISEKHTDIRFSVSAGGTHILKIEQR